MINGTDLTDPRKWRVELCNTLMESCTSNYVKFNYPNEVHPKIRKLIERISINDSRVCRTGVEVLDPTYNLGEIQDPIFVNKDSLEDLVLWGENIDSEDLADADDEDGGH